MCQKLLLIPTNFVQKYQEHIRNPRTKYLYDMLKKIRVTLAECICVLEACYITLTCLVK